MDSMLPTLPPLPRVSDISALRLPAHREWTEEEIEAASEVSEDATLAMYRAMHGAQVGRRRTGASTGRGKRRKSAN